MKYFTLGPYKLCRRQVLWRLRSFRRSAQSYLPRPRLPTSHVRRRDSLVLCYQHPLCLDRPAIFTIFGVYYHCCCSESLFCYGKNFRSWFGADVAIVGIYIRRSPLSTCLNGQRRGLMSKCAIDYVAQSVQNIKPCAPLCDIGNGITRTCLKVLGYSVALV